MIKHVIIGRHFSGGGVGGVLNEILQVVIGFRRYIFCPIRK